MVNCGVARVDGPSLSSLCAEMTTAIRCESIRSGDAFFVSRWGGKLLRSVCTTNFQHDAKYEYRGLDSPHVCLEPALSV